MTDITLFEVQCSAIAEVAGDLSRWAKLSAQNVEDYTAKSAEESDEDGYYHKEAQKNEFARLLYLDLLEGLKKQYMKGI